MKTSLKKNNKFWTVALAVIVSISCILGLWTVVYAQEQKSEAPTKNEAVQTEVEVNVRYIFEDEMNLCQYIGHKKLKVFMQHR